MTLDLSSSDQLQLASAIDVLLSPLDYPDLDAWRSTVNNHVRQLLGGDQAAFQLPVDGVTEIYSDEYPGIDRDQYFEMMSTLTEKIPFWTRTRRLGVYNRDMAWQPHLDLYYRSTYYNEFVVPIRSFDVVGLAAPISDTNGWKGVANLLVSHESPHGPVFGEQGLAILRLLFPAFEAGIQTYLRLSEHQTTLIRSLDLANQGLLLCTATGRVLHRNIALVRMLDKDPERHTLTQALSTLALKLANLRRTSEMAHVAGQTPVGRYVSTPRARYRIYGSYVSDDHGSQHGYIVTTLEEVTPCLPTLAQLRARFSLTRREAQVTLYLAQRRRNNEIAEHLCISPHTARHHTEQVLAKLGVHSRDDVRATIIRATIEPS